MVYMLEDVLRKYFVRGFYGLGVGGFLYVQSVVRGFGIKGFFRVLFFCFYGFTVYVRISSGSLCLSEFWVSEGCFRAIVLECQRFQSQWIS